MSLSDRYTQVLLRSSAHNLAEARKSRLRLAAVRQNFRLKRTAAEAAQEEWDPLADVPEASGPSPVFLSPEMKEKLQDMGYESADIKKMTPEVAQQLISSGVTKQKQEQAASRREKLFDSMEEKVLKDLQAIKRRLDVAKSRLEKAHSQVESLDSSLAEVEEQREASSDPQEQEKLRKKSEWIQTHIDRAEKAESSIRREIEALDKLVSSITKTEDGLIDELQEANDSAVVTPGTEDDQIIEQLMAEKLVELGAISKLRKQLFQVQKTLDRKMEKLMRCHRDIAQLIDSGGSHYEVNTLKEAAEALQSSVDEAEKEQKALIREILRHEDKLRDVHTEERLQEMDEVLKDLPPEVDIDALQEKSKEQIQQEDLGKDIASKPQRYKKKADEMLAFADQVSQRYGDFILSFLAPDIPSDPKVDSFISTANSAILKRAQEAKALATPYSRNPMHRSAILLIPSLYEFLASTMNGVLDPGTKEAMLLSRDVSALHLAFVEAGMVKEAIDLQQIMDTSKSIGKGLGDAARWTKEKGKQVGDGINSFLENRKELKDRRKFQEEDSGAPRRDPAQDLKRQQVALGQLIEIEQELRSRLERAQSLQAELQTNGDLEGVKTVRNKITQLQDQLNSVGERKDLLGKGLAHKPGPGLMKSQEQAAQRPKTDFEQATRLLSTNTPKLMTLLKEGIPSDENVEQELLRHSARVADAVNRMIVESYKAKKLYPNLPPTIQAYGHMFLALDDALHKALRSGQVA